MIYFDAGATTLQKPEAVARAMYRAVGTLSSPGRGSYPATRAAEETDLRCRTLAAELYAPILECNVDAASQVLPFQVAAASADYWRIIGVVAAMMAVAALVLGRTVYRLRAGEALKLGED